MKKKLLLTVLCALASSSYAEPLGRCGSNTAQALQNSYVQNFQAYRGQVAFNGATSAVSITMPASNYVEEVRFDNRTDWLSCAEVNGNGTCGTNPPTTTVSNTAWVFKPTAIRMADGRNLLWVSNTVPGSTGTLGYSVCEER